MYYIGQQIVLEGSPSFYFGKASVDPTYDSSAYDPSKSSLIAVSFIVPAIVTLFALLGYLFRPLFYYRPRWTNPFIVERFEQQDDFLLKSKKDHRLALLIILLASVAGLTLQTITSCLFQWHFSSHSLCVSWAVGTLLIIIDRPKSAPMALLMLYLSIVASKSVALIDQQHRTLQLSVLETPSLILALIIVVFILVMPLRDSHLSNEGINPAFDIPNPDSRSPEDNLTLWQFMTVSWMKPLISVGNKRQLNDEDVWGLPYEFRHRCLHNAFRELSGSVVRRLLRANGIDLVILSALGLLELVANFSMPVLLQRILSSMEDARSPKRFAILYALLSLVVRQIAAQSAVFSYWFSRRCYERSRGEMITMLYEKTLSRKIVGLVQGQMEKTAPRDENEENYSCGGPRLFFKRFLRSINVCLRLKSHTFKQRQEKDTVRKNASMGKILNIMRNDVYEVAQRFWEFQTLINRPLGLILSIVLIWKLIGWPCLIGILTVVSAQCVNALIARILLGQEKKRRVATDSKTHQITQFVESIRHLRWYGWQKAWLDRILEKRQRELNLRMVTGLLGILINFINSLASGMFPVAAFYAYTALAGLPLRIDLAFPALQLFTMLETNMRDIPNLITVLINASVAVGRIEDFMNEPNKEDSMRLALPSEELGLNNATFAWPGSQHIVLLDVTLSFPVGLTVIRGRVGVGKTALLQALLGELDLVNGSLVRPNQVVGFCAQSPWLQSMSIRENILFHTPYEEPRYKQVLDACALIPDLASFKDGDLSNLGDNGVGLSGGQRARVALARAVYSKAEILLLDDPLSALDHETADKIIYKCLLGPITRGRIIILVTHRTSLCEEYASQVIEVSGPTVSTVRNESSVTVGDGIGKRAEFNEQVVNSLADERLANDAAPDKFVEDEHRAYGGVKASVYWEYIKAGQLKWWVVLICFVSIYRIIAVGESWFLKQWAEAYGRTQQSIASLSGFFRSLPSPEANIRPWLLGFFLIALAQSIMFLVSQAFMVMIVYCAGRQMFKHTMHRVSHSTFRFFDITPVGRLMNRMTSDMNTIDGHISFQLQNVAWLSITWVSSIVVIAAVTPIFLVFSLALTLAFVMIFLRFLPTSQSLRRLEMVSLSPLMSNFGSLVDGLTTVRAFRVQERFQDRVIAVTDAFQKMDHFYWSLQAWLMFRFDSLSACSTFLLTLLSIFTNVSPGLTAFVLVAASQFVTSTHSLCKQYGQLQMDFVSVERVAELLHLEQEPPGDIEPPAAWPTFSGNIVFEDVTIRYAPHFDPALSDISFTIKGGSNTAIVGRTGSGKSTLALSLLATILPCKGRILINNVDISKVNKQALRSRVTFVAQDPVLFPGTIRQNLDPISEHTDFECETVLAKICGERGYGWTLDTMIDTGGSNLSQGQRQLIGLARAILRRSAVVILDEATASIDLETASRIQKILRKEMSGRTIVTIAHRVEAVEHADHFIVLGNGRVLEEGAVFR